MVVKDKTLIFHNIKQDSYNATIFYIVLYFILTSLSLLILNLLSFLKNIKSLFLEKISQRANSHSCAKSFKTLRSCFFLLLHSINLKSIIKKE